MIIIIILIGLLVFHLRPWIDICKNYKGEKYILLWYTNFKGERNYIRIGGQY